MGWLRLLISLRASRLFFNIDEWTQVLIAPSLYISRSFSGKYVSYAKHVLLKEGSTAQIHGNDWGSREFDWNNVFHINTELSAFELPGRLQNIGTSKWSPVVERCLLLSTSFTRILKQTASLIIQTLLLNQPASVHQSTVFRLRAS